MGFLVKMCFYFYLRWIIFAYYEQIDKKETYLCSLQTCLFIRFFIFIFRLFIVL